MSAIYSGASGIQPRCLGQTPLHVADHATTFRAIADIWLPRACESENTRQQRVNQEPRNPGKEPKKLLMFFLRETCSRMKPQTSPIKSGFPSEIASIKLRL